MVPPGFASDAIAEPYGTFSYLPSLGRWVRIRYYTVPISYPIYNGPDGTYSYGSFNYDEDKNNWPGYGECGPQGPYWVNGDPPPWPPLALSAEGISEKIVRTAALARSGMEAERLAEGFSRSLALARTPLSAARESESVVRTLSAIRRPSEAERCESRQDIALTVARSPVESERCEESRSLAVSVSRSPIEAERTESLPTAYAGTNSCSLLTHAHYYYTVTVSGVTNGSCTDCANANGTHTFTWQAFCNWQTPGITICGFSSAWSLSVSMGIGSTVNVMLSAGPLGLYQANSVSWDGNSPLVLSGFGSPQCSNVPTTMTIVPA